MDKKNMIYRAPELYLEDFGCEYVLCTSLPPIPEESETW